MKRARESGGNRARVRIRITAAWHRRWVRVATALAALPVVVLFFAAGYYYVSFARLIDERLQGTRDRVLPRVFARPLELRRGQALSEQELVDRLNDLGYTERADAGRPGEFAIEDGAVSIVPRPPELKGQPVRVTFRPPQPPVQNAARSPSRQRADRVVRLVLGDKNRDRVTLDAPLLTSLTSGERAKRRAVSLGDLPPHVVQAVLAIEDRRYYSHPGVDPIRVVGALLDSLRNPNRPISAVSTITQQVVRNVFLPQFEGWSLASARARSLRRKALENLVALVLNTRASKDEILELYLNDMPLGQRGSFAIVGVAEAARLFFGKDVRNVSLPEAATMAGVLQSPSALSPFNNPERSRERRNVVLGAMVDAGYISREAADAAAAEPLVVVQRALESEAPHFVDFVAASLEEQYPGLTTSPTEAVDVYTTLDHHLQRVAQDAVRSGLTRVDELLSRRRRKGRAEAVLLAVDPRTGEVLAMVGGRSYNQSQFNRATLARRQPGSVFKPFVYLAAFEASAENGSPGLTPASIVEDTPASWEFDDQVWTPENYQQEYDGPVTLRRALAHSRNIATIRVAELTGYDRVAAQWQRLGIGNPPKPYPSIALGVFEATPYEIATAYTIFPNLGVMRPLKHIAKLERGGEDVTRKPAQTAKAVARPETTYLVTSMLRSVLNEGTGAGARGAGFTLDGAGKTGTTNDLRDAWFVGFTPTLLTVVWVGFDDNQPLGLSGSQAALPIWSQFMTRALAGRASQAFEAPDGISFVDIDPDTGRLAQPGCPRVVREGFVSGSEPLQACELHRF